MIISPINIITTRKYNTINKEAFKPTKPYANDTVSFCALKKSELSPVDLYCAELFKPPLERFDNKKDFDKWANKEFYEKSDINLYYSRDPQDNIDRITRLDIWKENLKNSVYENNPAMALIILDSITAPLSADNHEQPPIHNSRVMQSTIDYIKENLSQNKDFQFNYRKLYENTLRHYAVSGESTVGMLDTMWVKIPTAPPKSEEFRKNVKLLKILSHRSWCTKATHADSYLRQGDFYIYLDKGQPKACIRMENSDVAEIECENNNCEIPEKYLNEVLRFIEDKDLNTDKFSDVLLGAQFEKLRQEKMPELYI